MASPAGAKSRYLAALRDHSPVEKGRAKVLQSSSSQSPHYYRTEVGTPPPPPPPPPPEVPMKRASSPRPRSATPPPPRPEDEMPRRGTNKGSSRIATRWINAVESIESPTASDKENSSKKAGPTNERVSAAGSNDVPKARTAHELAAMFEQTPPPPPPPPPPRKVLPAVARGPSPDPGSGRKRRNDVPRDPAPQLIHQKKQWDANKDIPRGSVRNSPFTPAPEIPPAQLMHQKNQWDASRDVPHGKVAAVIRLSSGEKRVMSPPKRVQSPISPQRKKNDQWTTVSKKSVAEDDPPQTKHQRKQWNAMNDIPVGTVQHSPFGKKDFFRDDALPSNSPKGKAWGDIGIEETNSGDNLSQKSGRTPDMHLNIHPWDDVGDPALTLEVKTSESADTLSTASPISSPTSIKKSLLGVPFDEDLSSPMKTSNSTEDVSASPTYTPAGKVRGMTNIFERSSVTQPAPNLSTGPLQAELMESAKTGKKEVDDDGFFVDGTSPREEGADPWILSGTPTSQLFSDNAAKWGASAATSPESNDGDSVGSKEWFQSTSFDADTKDDVDSKLELTQASTGDKSIAQAVASNVDAILGPNVTHVVDARDSVESSAVSESNDDKNNNDDDRIRSKKGKKKRGIFSFFGGSKRSSKKKDKGTTSRSVSTMEEQSIQIMPSSSAVSFVAAFADKSVGTEAAIVEQKGPESLPDIKNVDDDKNTSIALDVPPAGDVSPTSPPSSGVISLRSLKENYGSDVTYTRSLDDTTVSEMTNPTVFQNKTAAQVPTEDETTGVSQEPFENVTPVEKENTGVSQEASGNVGTQKLTTNVSEVADKSNIVPDPFDAISSIFSSVDPFGVLENTGVSQETSGNVGTQKPTTKFSEDADKSNIVSDPFDTTSSIFSSIDPFGVPLSETTVFDGTVFEGPAFADDFFTPLESEASKLNSKSTSEDLLFDSIGDLPLDVVEMASSDEEEEGDAPKINAKKIRSLAPPPVKAVASKAKPAGTKTAILTGQTDDPPLDLLGMDSSDDEPIEKSMSEFKSIPDALKTSPSKSGSLPSVSSPRLIETYVKSSSSSQSKSKNAPASPSTGILLNMKGRKLQQQQQKKKKMEQEAKVEEKARAPVDVPPRPSNRSEVNASRDDSKSEVGSVPSSSASRQSHPAAEAVGKSSSQRARIIAKHRRNRPDSNAASAHNQNKDTFSRDMPREIYGPASTSSSVKAPAQRLPVQRAKTAVLSQSQSPYRVENAERSKTGTISQQEKVPVQPQFKKVYAVERPRSILKKPRLALPADPAQYTPYEDITDPMQLAGLRLLAAAVIPIQAAMRMFLARRERLNRMWAVIVMQSYMRRRLCRQKYIADIDAVIAIQKTYRGWLARDLVEDQHYCATQIQRMVRGYMATLSVYESIYKVTLVQSYVRMKLAMDEATYRMALIIQVQSIIRGYLVRKGMELATTSATLVQAAWRGYYSCMTYQYDVLDIIIVQSLVRRRAARLCVQQKREDRMDRSATLIQAQWRSYDCTMNYLHYLADVLIVQSAVRRWRAERQYEDLLTLRDEEEARRKEIAAIQIQRCWRGFICYADYMFTVSDIVVVQSQIRRWLARRYLSRLKNVREVEAATNIQRHWRGSLGRDDAIMRLIEIIICQSIIRRFLAQAEYGRRRERMERELTSSIRIQKAYRGYKARQLFTQKAKVASLFDASSTVGHDQYDAAVVIQRHVRGSNVRENLLRNASAQMIQTQWRGYYPRRNYREYRAAVRIQTLYRMKKKFSEYKRFLAARRIQLKWRCSRDSSAYTKYRAAVRIQSMYRGAKAYVGYKRYRAATGIQTVWRAKVAQSYYKQYVAARCIQATWRGKYTHIAYTIYQAESLAATFIQTAWRGFVCQTDYLIALNDIIIVQTVARRRLATKEVSSLRREKVEYYAVLDIQRSFRGYKGRSIAKDRQAHLENEKTCQAAAVVIQRYWRGYDQTQQYRSLLTDVVHIQSLVRGLIVRDRVLKEHLAARIIQTAWRGKFARVAYKVYKVEKFAATLIQTAWRRFVCETDYYITLDDIVTVQNLVRQSQACKRVTSMRNERAALNIQRSFRGHKGRSQARDLQACLENKRRRQQAATYIQRTWRGYDQKQQYWFLLLCAIQIQSIVRGLLVRDQLKREHFAATEIQSAWRGKSDVTTYQQYRAARTIQAAWRGKFAHAAYMIYLAEKLAATLIQSTWRCFVAHTDYILTVCDIVIAQKTARRLLACKKVGGMRNERAALNIQRSFRGHMGRSYASDVRAYLENERRRQQAAIDIQRTWRGYNQKQVYQFTVDQAVQIQSVARGMIVRDQLGRDHAAATDIQSAWRGKSAVNAYQQYRSARTIQAAWRGKFARIEYMVYLAEILAATLIQSAWRGFVAHTDYILIMSDIVVAQKMARRLLACKKITSMRVERAALNIQRSFRGHMGRSYARDVRAYFESEKRRQQAAIDIQRTWRGYDQKQVYQFTVDQVVQIQAVARGMIVRDQLGRDNAAATDIQSAWRGKSAITAYQQYHAARTIQAAWRGKFAHVAYMIYLAEKLAATLIQSTWRCFVAHTDYILTVCDIVIAQKTARRLLACKKVGGMRNERAALNIQRSFRGHMGRSYASDVRAYLENERRRQQAAIDIQRTWRGYNQKQVYQFTVDQAVQIQSVARGMIVRDQLGRDHAAATDIQSAWRGKSAVIAYKKYRSARTIQAAWRGKFAHIEYMVYLAEILAATLIQSAWRGFVAHTDYILTMSDIVVAQKMARRLLACKKITSMRNERAALNIQRSFRGHTGRSFASDVRAYLENERRRQQAAIDIQRTWRGYDQKHVYQFTVDQAVQIQSVARGMIVRDQLGRDHAAATDIQSAWRGKSAVIAYKKYRSARTIQAAWRGKFAHIEYMVYLAEILAATLIQSAWRGFVAHTDYILIMSDIVVAQKMARRLLACKKITSMRVERAALNIQRSFRGHKGRSNAKDRRAYLENERVCQKAVTDIQRSWRGHDQRQQYWLTLDCVVRIQSIMRGKFVRDQLGKEQFAATKIQAIARGRSAHSAYIVFLAEQLAAVMIQSLWRGFVCYTDYIFTLGDVLTVQKMVRKYLACKKMSAIRQEKAKLDSAIAIQRTWRGHFEQQRYWYLLGCTIQLQRAVRGAMIRDRLAVEHAAAIKIQTAVRQWQTIARFRRTRLAIMSLAAMGTLNESQKAIRKIETWYLTESRSKKTREEEAAVCLQNWWIRQSLAEKLQIHAMEQFAAVIIQRWWRFVLFYQCDKEDAAATAIQVWWQLWKARMTRKKLISERDQAACTIQHFFLMVKAMVDREIRAEKRRRKRKKMYKKFHTPEMEEALLETIWTNTVETPRTSHKSIPFSRSTSHRTSSRSVPRPQQENIPTKSCPRNSRISRRLSLLASEVSKDLFEDASVMSHYTVGSSVYHVAPSSRSKLTQKDLDEDNALEEAWIDTEINFLAEKGRTSSKQRRSSSKQRRSSRGAV